MSYRHQNSHCMKYIIILMLSFLAASCHSYDCNALPAHYSTYEQAIKKIRGTHFKIRESCNTSSSSWIRAAEYYSCDGETGFFLMETDRQWYIHSNMPISVWEEFKKASSRGSYYDYHIKNRYTFIP